MVGCSSDDDGGIPSAISGAYYYKNQALFTIDSDGMGSIGSQGGYSVNVLNYDSKSYQGSVKFSQGSTETGRYTFAFNGDFSGMWIQSGTGPFEAWANIEPPPSSYVIKKAGIFTLTDIPAQYNGKYAILFADGSNDWNLWGCIIENSTGSTLPQISGGKVVIPLFLGGVYTGNDTYVTTPDFSSRIFVKLVNNKVIKNLDEPGDAVFFNSVTFSGGSAKKSYNDRRK
jgi:hypothetical protein